MSISAWVTLKVEEFLGLLLHILLGFGPWRWKIAGVFGSLVWALLGDLLWALFLFTLSAWSRFIFNSARAFGLMSGSVSEYDLLLFCDIFV